MANKICPFCKKDVSANDAICPHCTRILFEKIDHKPSYTNSTQNENRQTNQSTHTHKINQKEKVKNFFSKFIFWKNSTSYHKDGNIYYVKQNKADRFKKIGVAVAVTIFLFGLVAKNSNPVNSIQTINIPTNTTIESVRAVQPRPLVKDPSEYNFLANGKVISSLSYYLNGNGKLVIKNGTNDDAVVKLIRSSIDKSVYTAYIRAKSNHTITSISDGNYELLFMHGKDWDNANQTFLVNKSYSKFTDDFYFTTQEVEQYDGVYEEYSVYEITLHPVIGGTAKTTDISIGEFDKY